MKDSAAINAFAALSHERRLGVFHLLAERGLDGMNAGAIATALEVPPSSLSFHLSQLEQSGLVSSRRRRRQIVYSVVPESIAGLVAYLVEEGSRGDAEFRASVIDLLSGRPR